MKRVLGATAVLSLLTGCATAYQPVGLSGGYSQTQLSDNIFQVSFRGNGYTSAERASDFTLLRAAQLTLSHGFRYFVIVNSNERTKTSAMAMPAQSYTTAQAYGYGNYAYGNATTTTYGGQTFVIAKPRATDTIICFKEKPNNNALVFDAQFVEKSIEAKYAIKG